MARPTRAEWERDEIVFAVCERFLVGRSGTGDLPQEIADALNRERGLKLTRERIYPLVRAGVERGFVLLSPPAHRILGQRLADRYGSDAARIRVVASRGKPANAHVAGAGAEVLLGLIAELGRTKDPVHLGLGSGWTSMLVARRLAQLLGRTALGPRLVLHALSSGFDVTDPMRAPVAFFSFFQELPVTDGYVGLFASATVPSRAYERVKRQPGVRESFERAKEVDIVVTSLASANDAHGALNRFLQLGAVNALTDLRRRGWVGDVQYLPYSARGPITLRRGIRAVTLLELSDLVAMVRTGRRYVVLVGGPCGECASTKADALRPLLQEPNLRVWSHLVTDARTAEELLRPG